MKFRWLFSCVFLPIICFSQNKHHYKVLAVSDSLPIVDAHISVGNWLTTLSDAEGNFSIKKDFESIQISHLLYKPLIILKKDLQSNTTIYLQDNQQSLKEVMLNNKAKRDVIMPRFKKKTLFQNESAHAINQNSVAVTFIANNLKDDCFIKAILVEVSNKKAAAINSYSSLTPFRVNLYSKDSITGFPKDKLLSESILTGKVERAESNFVKVDLSNFDIDFPKEGVFVAVESLNILEIERLNKPIAISPVFIGIKRKVKDDYVSYNRLYSWNRATKSVDEIEIDWGKNHFGYNHESTFIYNFGIEIECY